MAKTGSNEPFLLQDRVFLAALCFGSAGYIVIGSWPGIALLVAGFMMGAIWAFRTAQTHKQLGMRILAAVLLVTLGTYLTVYVSFTEGVIK